MSKINTGSHVRVKPYKRLRTIFTKGEYSPGKWYDKPGYTGTVISVEDDGMDGNTYYIQSDTPRGEGVSYEYHSAEEFDLLQ